MTVAINPADKSLIVVIELLLLDATKDLWVLGSELMPKTRSRPAFASNVCRSNQSIQRIVFVILI